MPNKDHVQFIQQDILGIKNRSWRFRCLHVTCPESSPWHERYLQRCSGIIPALTFHSTMPHLPAYLPSLTLHYKITSQVSCLESACQLTLTTDTPRSTTLPGFQSKGEKGRERITALITHDATDPYDDGALPAFFFF